MVLRIRVEAAACHSSTEPLQAWMAPQDAAADNALPPAG
ncbi:hypothetical protein XOC_0166 [Xanthomonas oryzae pv. oryzicola BLS256]|uniref:Uncharacterized protein n=1 Tax=Xanthomonas oryzae pv. oryzicola (strain BLS256) TaxID=383407 RepID=G7TJL7_XANOB|nr:hypothetical protein XOC_0166 [Xanthomonas oryzae pv. oryzicola BLS256]